MQRPGSGPWQLQQPVHGATALHWHARQVHLVLCIICCVWMLLLLLLGCIGG
jgi:hypothetical protein